MSSTPGPSPVTPAVVPGTPERTDADRVASLVLGCSSVAALHGGRWGEVATYLPGRRVSGVRVHLDLVEVHVVGRYPVPVPDIARQIRTALHTETGGTPVEVVVEDYADPSAPAQPPAPGPVETVTPPGTP